MQIKRERLQLEGYFFKFRKASIADLITLLSSSEQTLMAVATATAAIVVLFTMTT
jgi:hypothetical protein